MTLNAAAARGTGRRALAAAPLLVALLGCGAEAGDSLSRAPVTGGESADRQISIVNGQPTDGFANVGQQDGCSATLVGTRTVLTAGHCLANAPNPTFQIGGRLYPGTRVLHPGYDDATLANDIGLVMLSEAPPIAPSTVLDRPPAVGQPVTFVGFGVTSDNGSDSGVKRMATNTIARVDPTTIWINGGSGAVGNTCYGDSGGPMFVTVGGVQAVAGVTSYGNGACGIDGVDTRVDAFKDWIVQASGGDVRLASAGASTAPTTPAPSLPPTPTVPGAPSLLVLSPQSGALTANRFVVKVDARDDTGDVWVTLVYPPQFKARPPYDFEVELPDGPHVLQLEAQDANGNRVQTSLQVYVNSGPPASPEATTPQPAPGVDAVQPGAGAPSPAPAGSPQVVGVGCRLGGSAPPAPPPWPLALVFAAWIARRRRQG